MIELACRVPTQKMVDLAKSINITDKRLGAHIITKFMQENNLANESQVSAETLKSWWNSQTKETQREIAWAIPPYKNQPNNRTNVITFTQDYHGDWVLSYPEDMNALQTAVDTFLSGNGINAILYPDALKELATFSDIAMYLMLKQEYMYYWPQNALKVPQGFTYDSYITTGVLNKMKEYHRTYGYPKLPINYVTSDKAGSEGRLSFVDKGVITVKNNITIKEFLSFLGGTNQPSATNTRNNLAIQKLTKQYGITWNQITQFFNNPHKIRQFLLLKEYYGKMHPELMQRWDRNNPTSDANVSVIAEEYAYAWNTMHNAQIQSVAPGQTTQQQLADSGYSKIQGITAQYGVRIDSNLKHNYAAFQTENPNGLVAYRVNFNVYNTPEEAKAGRIGNPFSEGQGNTNKGDDTVQKFYEWLVTGNNFGESKATEAYRQSIITKLLNTEVGSPILYYKELNRPSHATVLGYLINNKNLLISKTKETKGWATTSANGYEVSTSGDTRFSALNATFKQGTVFEGVDVGGYTIEEVYQTLVKQGKLSHDWKSGKGRAPIPTSIISTSEKTKDGSPAWVMNPTTPDLFDADTWNRISEHAHTNSITKEDVEDYSYARAYKPLWELWASQNPKLIEDLRQKSAGKVLTDKFASKTTVTQARALSDILNKTNNKKNNEEFTELQRESSRMSPEDISKFHSLETEISENERQRISGIFARQLESSRASRGNSVRSDLDSGKGTKFSFIEKVDGQLFHDIFQIVRNYLPNGELVDLHDNYDGVKCYISPDGLSGFAIEADGNLVSVFNLSDKKGFLYAIKDYIKEKGATHLDGYNSNKQPLGAIYSKALGWSVASLMDYNMEYDHDDIAKNHGNPQVAFMVAKSGVETRHFDKDSYDAAQEYQKSLIQQKSNKKVTLSTVGYKKGDPQTHSDVDYVFTENAEAYAYANGISLNEDAFPYKNAPKINVSDMNGTNQAGIRTDAAGNISPNAFGIVVKHHQQNAEGEFVAEEGQFNNSDEDYDLFTSLNEDMFDRLDASANEKVMFPTQMGLGKAALPWDFARWLQKELQERYGLKSEIQKNSRKDYNGYGLQLDPTKMTGQDAPMDEYSWRFKLQTAPQAQPLADTPTPNKQQAVAQAAPININTGRVESNVLISPNEDSPIYKLNSQLDSTQITNRINMVARRVSMEISAVIKDLINDLQTYGTTQEDFDALAAIQDTETGRKKAIPLVIKEALNRVYKYYSETYEDMKNSSLEEIVDNFGYDSIEQAAYIRDQYKILLDNFDTIFSQASSAIEAIENLRIVQTADGSFVFDDNAEDNNNIQNNNEDNQGAEPGEDGDGAASGNEGYSYESRMVDPHKTTRSVTRKLLGSLIDYTTDGIEKTDDLGEIVYVREDVAHSILLDEMDKAVLRGEQFVEKDADGNYTYPIFNELAKRYTWVNQILNDIKANPDHATALYCDLYKPFQQYWSQGTTTLEDGSTVFQTFRVNDTIGSQTVLDTAQQNFMEHKVLTEDMVWDKSGAINLEHCNALIKRLEAVNKQRREGVISNDNLAAQTAYLLNSIGIESTQDTIKAILNSANGVDQIRVVLSAINTVVGGAVKTSSNPNLVFDYKTAYKVIAAIVGEVDNTHNANMFRQAGKDFPSYTPPNYIDYLKQGFLGPNPRDFMLGEFAYDDFLFDSERGEFRNPIMQALFTDQEVRANLETKYIKIFENAAGEDAEYKNWTRQDILENYLFEFFSAEGTGVTDRTYANYTLPIPSDSEMGILIKLPRYVKNGANTVEQQVNKACVDIIKQELSRIKKVEKRKAVHADEIQSYDKFGGKFLFFPQLNTFKVDGTRTLLQILQDENFKGDVDAVILDAITKINEARFEEFYNNNQDIRLKHVGSVDKDSKREYLKEFFYNNTVAQATIIQIMTTDLAYYKNYTDFQKRFKQVFASGTRLNTKAKYGREIERSIYLADKICTSPTYSGIITSLDRAVKNGLMTDSQRGVILKKLRDINQDDAQAFRSLSSMRSVLSMYGKWDERTMGAAFDRMSRGEYSYSDLSIVWGTLKPFIFANVSVDDGLGGKMRTPVQHKDSEYTLLAFVQALDNAAQQHNKASDSAVIRGLNKAMEKFQIDKAIFESGVKAGGQCVIDLSHSIAKLTALKESAEWPLFMEDAKKMLGKKFDKTSDYYKYKAALDYRILNAKNQIERDAYQDFYNREMKRLMPNDIEVEQYIDKALHYNAFEEFKKQFGEDLLKLDIEDKDDFLAHMDYMLKQSSLGQSLTQDEVNFLTKAFSKKGETVDKMTEGLYSEIMDKVKPYQTFKTFTDEKNHTWTENANVIHEIPYKHYMEAQPSVNHLVDSESVFGSQFRNLITSDMDPNMVINVGGKLFRARNEQGKNEIIELYQKCITMNLLSAFKELQKEFGSLKDLQTHLMKMIQSNATYGLEMLDAIQIVTIDGVPQFNIPFHNPTICNKMEQLVLSMFKNNITKQKIRGAACVLVTDFGYDSELQVVRDQETGAILGFECMLPASSKHILKHFLKTVRDRKGNIIGQQIDMDKIKATPGGEELLKGVGFRIPTEAKYSMANMIIKGFLPQQNGSVVMMPAECTALAGWDFDRI